MSSLEQKQDLGKFPTGVYFLVYEGVDTDTGKRIFCGERTDLTPENSGKLKEPLKLEKQWWQ